MERGEIRRTRRLRDATRVISLQRKPDAEAVASGFLDRQDVKDAFQTAVKEALPGIFGNESTGLQQIERRGNQLIANPDGDPDEAHTVVLKATPERHWVEIYFSMVPYGEDMSTEGKSPSRQNAEFSRDGVKYLASLIDAAYDKMESLIDRAYEGLSETDDVEDEFFEYKNLGRHGSSKLADFKVGDGVRYTFLSADPEFGPKLYDRLKAHLGKVARVVYVGYPGPESLTIRFKDGFTFEVFQDEVEKTNSIPTA